MKGFEKSLLEKFTSEFIDINWTWFSILGAPFLVFGTYFIYSFNIDQCLEIRLETTANFQLCDVNLLLAGIIFLIILIPIYFLSKLWRN